MEKEIQLIRDYINIQKLRIDETDDVMIAFNIEGTSKGKKIAPVILLPLVENCFKHGVKLDEKCLIKIHLKITNESLIFTTKNYAFAANQSEPVEENGIGLSNVKKRLEMEYLDNHQLKSSKEQPWFIVQLQLNKV